MADFLTSVESDGGVIEPQPVTIVSMGREVDLSGLSGGTAMNAAANLGTNQVSVGTTATLVVPARLGRKSITITAKSSVNYCLGNAGVTMTTGGYVAAGGGATVAYSGAIYAVADAAVTLSYIELY